MAAVHAVLFVIMLFGSKTLHSTDYPFEDILSYLEKENILEGDGHRGEPTLYDNLPDTIFKIKRSDQSKLDTNGTNPVMIKDLTDKKLLTMLLGISKTLKKYKNHRK